MIEEQKNELNEIIDLEVEVAISHIKSGISNLLTGIKRFNWLLKNHFDIYDLIPMGLQFSSSSIIQITGEDT